MDLHTYNAFGLIKVTRYQVWIMATASTTDGDSINRSVIDVPDEPILPLGVNETGAATFGALIQPGKKFTLTIHDINRLESGLGIGDLAPVTNAIRKVLKKIQDVSYAEVAV